MTRLSRGPHHLCIYLSLLDHISIITVCLRVLEVLGSFLRGLGRSWYLLENLLHYKLDLNRLRVPFSFLNGKLILFLFVPTFFCPKLIVRFLSRREYFVGCF